MERAMKGKRDMRYALISLLAWISAGVLAAADCPRIVSQSPYITHQLAWLGVKQCIVGASRYERSISVANTGGVMDPDEEAIRRLNPDWVITSVWTAPEKLAAATPPGARALRLASFQSMTQIEENLAEIGQALGLRDWQARSAAFAHLWRKKAAAIGGGGQRVLLLSSCTGAPYSFGRNTWLGELFEAAGFTLAEEAQGVRHLPAEGLDAAIAADIARLQPEIVFYFSRQTASACAAMPLPAQAKIIGLDGDLFLHPAPVLLEGLEQLRTVLAQEIFPKEKR